MKPITKIRPSWPLFLFVILSARWTPAQTAPQAGPTAGSPQAGQEIPTQKIDNAQADERKPVTIVDATGSMQAAQVKEVLEKVRFSEYRIKDLLTDVHPEKWKLPQTALDSFNLTLKTLHDQVDALEQWRSQFEQRTDSVYLGFQTYATINAVLPRLNGVTESIAERETPGYAAQFSRASDQLFDLQQNIGQYVSSLLKSQDQVLVDYAGNMAACQQSLSEAMRSKPARAKYTPNSRPIRPLRRSLHSTARNPAVDNKQGKTESRPGEKKPAQPRANDPVKK